MISRRKFFGFLGGAAALPVLKLPELVETPTVAHYSGGFSYCGSKVTFDELIRTTLHNKSYLIAENLSKHNPLYTRLKEKSNG